MSTFVLVHGSSHGGWAWERMVPLLEEAGHGAEAPDLPGHGDDQTPPEKVTLEGYAGRIVGVLGSLSEPAVLVGHSLGGAVISEAAERRPEKVKTLVYVNAYLLPDGISVFEISQQDAESTVRQNIEVDQERGVAWLRPEAIKDAFYGECSEEDAAWAQARIRDEPIGPLGTPVHVTEGNFGRVPRAYVTCMHDRAVTPQGQQREMYTRMPCREVVSMQTDHSPFLSRPEELARHLMSFSAT